MNPSRRSFLKCAALGIAASPTLFAASGAGSSPPAGAPSPTESGPVKNLPTMLDADGRLRLDFGEERMVLNGGLQPFLFCTASGAFVVQAQSPEKPFPSPRMHYTYAMNTVISRDGGNSWAQIPLKPGENGLNLEGGAVQLRDGTILALDTYITPGARPGQGIGQLYTSRDDWRTF